MSTDRVPHEVQELFALIGDHPDAAILDVLGEQRDIWAEKGISDYMITVEIRCFCPEEFRGPFEATVVDGNVDTVTMNGESVEPIDETLLTVEGLFSTIEWNAYSGDITVTYAPDGHPSVIVIDPSPNAVDDQLSIHVHDLTAANP